MYIIAEKCRSQNYTVPAQGRVRYTLLPRPIPHLFSKFYLTTASYSFSLISDYIKKLICMEKNNITDSIEDSNNRPAILLK
jgi:hypothetical protein